ncbi:preprotein translocase subunit SecD [Candidatus Pacearchaeota archaeon]|nr:preprotein translocase subunit SecD [Candidatus Pacearchaeota archaeon]
MASYKIWLLVIILIFCFLIIAPPWNLFEKGVVIQGISKNTSEFESGLRSGMILQSINGKAIDSVESYNKLVNSLNLEDSTKVSMETKSGTFIFYTNKELSLIVKEIPKTKIKTGLDLSGGARALIKAENKTLSDSEMSDLIAITSERSNGFGIKDITIKSVRDLGGESYMLIEVAGATPGDLEDLVENQGKFEGKIGNITVFSGGQDISHVERSGQQAGIEGCSAIQDGEVCRFRFPISLKEEAAKRQAEVTLNLGIDPENPQYLSQKLDLYLDDNLMDSLFISKDLKGQVATQIVISGSGSGLSRQEAVKEATKQMNKLQTILITGSLPFKLEIVKLDTISPVLGKEFTKNLLILGVLVFVIISAIIFIKYRKIKITSAVILTMFSEVAITLGIAALINWNLDAPSIAGIIAGMGTGVDDQIVLIDESVSNVQISLKEKIKRAFFVIFGAFFTVIAAMLPLFWAGAGMLKGFALTTILTITVGILITRPAFAEILRRIQE